MANKSTVSLDDILAALQGIATVQTDLASRLAAIENGATVQTVTAPSQPTVKTEAPKTAQRAARRENVKNTAPKAPAGTLTGTVVRIARGGYGLLVNVDGTEQWANAPAKGKNNKKLPALFANMQPGQSVTLTLDEYARVMPESVTASAAPAVKTPEPAVKTGQRGGQPCPFCAGPTHAKESCEKVTLACAQQQFKNETGKSAIADMIEFAAWYQSAPRQVFAHNATGSKFVGGGSNAASNLEPAVKTAPIVQTSAPAVKSDNLNGDHLVTLVKFDSKKSGMVMLHNLTDFAGVGKNAGKGRWVTDIDAAVYADMLAYNLNDRVLVSMADGRLIRAERVSSIEKETGIVAGVQKSGKQSAPIAHKPRRDATVVAARKTASRSKNAAGKPVYKCSGTAQHRTTCFGRCVNAA